MTPFTGKSCIASLLNEISFSLQTKTANKFVFACTTLLPYRGPVNSLFQTLCSPGGKKTLARRFLPTGIMSCDWSCDRSLDRRQKKNIHVKGFLLRSGDETRHDERTNETKWRSAEKLSHPVVTYVVTQYSLFVYAI